jgi:hypothetical protein
LGLLQGQPRRVVGEDHGEDRRARTWNGNIGSESHLAGIRAGHGPRTCGAGSGPGRPFVITAWDGTGSGHRVLGAGFSAQAPAPARVFRGRTLLYQEFEELVGYSMIITEWVRVTQGLHKINASRCGRGDSELDLCWRWRRGQKLRDNENCSHYSAPTVLGLGMGSIQMQTTQFAPERQSQARLVPTAIWAQSTLNQHKLVQIQSGDGNN